MMSDAELHAMARQSMLCYGYNRSASSPFALAFAGLQSAGALLPALGVHSWSHWVVQREDSPPWEAFASFRRLVYLSSDAEEVLEAMMC